MPAFKRRAAIIQQLPALTAKLGPTNKNSKAWHPAPKVVGGGALVELDIIHAVGCQTAARREITEPIDIGQPVPMRETSTPEERPAASIMGKNPVALGVTGS